MTEQAKRIRCAWCEIELAAIDAAPIKYARDRNATDEENMQCADYDACRARQAELDAAQRAEADARGMGWLFGRPSAGTEDGQ